MGFRTHSVSRPLQWSLKLQQNPLSQDAQKLHMAVMGNQQLKMWNVLTVANLSCAMSGSKSCNSSGTTWIGKIEKPKKADFRQRAHCNPLCDWGDCYPAAALAKEMVNLCELAVMW